MTDRGAASEEAVDFPSRFGLVAGVLHRPVATSRPIPVLLPPAGLRDRCGPMRLYVRLARRLAAAGHTVLRYDGAGLGESTGDGPSARKADAYEAIQSGALAEESIAAAEHLLRLTGAPALHVAGLCGGVLHGAELSRQRPDLVAGIIGIGTPALLTTVGNWKSGARSGPSASSTPSRSWLRRSGQRCLRRAADPAAWQRLWSGRTDYRTLARSLAAFVPAMPALRLPEMTQVLSWVRRDQAVGELAHVASRALAGVAQADARVDRRAWGSLVELRARGGRVALVWGDHDPARFAFEDFLAGPVPELVELFELHRIGGASHECATERAFDQLARIAERALDSRPQGITGIAATPSPIRSRHVDR